MKYLLYGLPVIFLSLSCQKPIYNPSAPGFDLYNSDRQAVQLADETMEAMGGRTAWDQTRHFSWSFFGRRHLIWDKLTGDVRIDVPKDSLIYLINVHTTKGSVIKQGEQITQPDSLAQYLKRAKNMWINDSYWLVMPFKLKDSGVTLSYARPDTLPSGASAHVLELLFKEVGVTPDNKYEVWIDQSDHLVKQWAYYAKADQAKPNAIWPWDNYKKYGSLLLSADRSDGKGPLDVLVFDTLEAKVYESAAVPDWLKL